MCKWKTTGVLIYRRCGINKIAKLNEFIFVEFLLCYFLFFNEEISKGIILNFISLT